MQITEYRLADLIHLKHDQRLWRVAQEAHGKDKAWLCVHDFSGHEKSICLEEIEHFRYCVECETGMPDNLAVKCRHCQQKGGAS